MTSEFLEQDSVGAFRWELALPPFFSRSRCRRVGSPGVAGSTFHSRFCSGCNVGYDGGKNSPNEKRSNGNRALGRPGIHALARIGSGR